MPTHRNPSPFTVKVLESLLRTQSGEPSGTLQQLLEKYVERAGKRSSTSIEIRAGALCRQSDGSYDIDAITASGPWKFIKAQKVSGDIQSELDEPWQRWKDVEVYERDVTAHGRLHVVSSTEVLEKLFDSFGAERRQLIFEAEQLRFEGASRRDLIDFLRRYIEENRDSNDREELIAVASAIRKCVAMIDVFDMGWVATLLETGHRAPVSVDVELEVAKMVFRKFSANPPAAPDPQRELAARLMEIAEAYLNPRILPRDRHATVAMLAIQSLLVMLSDLSDRVIERVNETPFRWFRQQLRRRMERVAIEWHGTASLVDDLRQLIDQIDSD